CSHLTLSFVFMLPPPPCSPLFPYTTLFRSISPLCRRTEIRLPLLRKHSLILISALRGRNRTNTPAILAPIVDLWRPNRLNYVLRDRKSTRLNSSHVAISYAVFCLKKKKNNQ